MADLEADTAAAGGPGNRDVGRRIKVMLTIDGLGVGGAEMVVRDLARRIDRRRFDLCLCVTKNIGIDGPIAEELRRDAIDFFVLPGRNDGVDYLSTLKFRHAVIERAPDVVHTHAPAALLDAAPVRLTVPRMRLVHTFHYGNYPYTSWRHHLLEGAFARAADRLIAVGYEQRRRLMAAYRLRESRIDVVWNGIPPPTVRAADGFRQEMATGKRVLVGTIAKLIDQKGLDDLLAVARRSVDAGREMQFVIVGEGPLRPMLEQKRKELGLDGTVVITGWIPNAAARALPAFDVFFQPSRWEAMSIAVLEAMANSKAIVATRVGDNPHVLEDGVSGLLVDSADIEGMTAALVRAADPSLRTRLGAAARVRYEQGFTLDTMVRNYERAYAELAATNPSAPARS